MRICICGGGNVAHAMAGHLAAMGMRPDVLTRKPPCWGGSLLAMRPDGEQRGELGVVSSDPALAAASDIIFLSVPQFALAGVVGGLCPYLHEGQALVMVPGVAEAAKCVPPVAATGAEALVLQRVPFICRTGRYGHSVHLLGGRPSNGLYAHSEEGYARYAPVVEALFGARIHRVQSLVSYLFSISNPILHPARLLSLFEDYATGKVYGHQFLFYREWNDRASELYLKADDELLAICRACPDEAARREFVPGRAYYESPNAEALTAKIRSIPAFSHILTPMLEVPGGWVPDFASRYFTEDIPFGTRPMVDYARQLGVATPTLDSFVAFGKRWMGRPGGGDGGA